MTDSSNRIHILDLTKDELARRCELASMPSFRPVQVFEWIYAKRCTDFAAMTNLGKLDRRRFADEYTILAGKQLISRKGSDGVEKLLIEFGPQQEVETVSIPAGKRLTACISTQFGCPVKCAFCASGQSDFAGNLSAGQIIEQLLRLQIQADRSNKRIGNLVVMGMGDPLLNYENVIKAVRIINSPYSFHIAARHITISTVGLPDQIRRLADEELQVTLAISLHSPDQAVREELIPLAQKHRLDQIIDAARYYFQRTGREVTLEYLMLDGINISQTDARQLAAIAQTIRANVNLIAYNPTDQSRFKAPDESDIMQFLHHLQRLDVNVHLRASKGRDIDAACGQLRKRYSRSARSD